MICSNCGHDNRSTARFCANCGSRLEEAAPVTQATPASAAAAPVAIATDAPAVTSPASNPTNLAPEPSEDGQLGTPEAVPDTSAAVESTSRVVAEPEATIQPLLATASTPVPNGENLVELTEGAPVDADAWLALEATQETARPPLPASAEESVVGGVGEVGDLPADDVTGAAPMAAIAEVAASAAPPGDVDVPDGDVSGEPSPALAAGTLVAERFLVLSYESSPLGEEYLVQDRGICVSCGARVFPTVEEPYCQECGAYLQDEQAPFAQRRLRQVEADSTDPEAEEMIAWEGMAFRVVDVLPDSTDESPTPATAQGGFPYGVTLLAGQRSDQGIMRAGRPDEDSIFALTIASVFESYARPAIGLYVVADGMGGHGDGEVASRIAAETVSTGLLQTIVMPSLQGQVIAQETIGALMDAAIVAANRRVYENAQARGNDMGTTLTLALVIDDQAYVANVGDSRTYLWRQGQLEQITEDHSAVYQLVKKGVLQPEDIYTHPRRNEIIRSLGFRPEVQVDYFHRQLAPHDALLLCCDGLWEMLHDDGIADVLLSNFGDVQTVCDALIKRANLAGGEDNISVVLVRAEV